MIEPNMATMLAFLLTDAAATPAFLRAALREAADRSFNRLTVDGEGSTSDTALLLASGARATRAAQRAQPRARALHRRAHGRRTSLARQLARDGEGATKLVLVPCRRAHGRRRRARRAPDRQLDAREDGAVRRRRELGRILQTIGAGRIALRLARTSVRLGGVVVFRERRVRGPGRARARAQALAAKSRRSRSTSASAAAPRRSSPATSPTTT
jgi:glutamate N-acetyltransferase/amino-acid N-acetyltransferase